MRDLGIFLSIVIAFSFAAIAFQIPATRAYATSCRWYDANIGYVYDSSYSTVDRFYTDYAVAVWNDVGGFVLIKDLRSDIVYHSVSDPDADWYGLTSMHCLFGYIIGPANVYINDYYSLSALARQAVIAHETGHAIGLDHSQYDHALMYAYPVNSYYLYKIYVPVYDDIKGVESLYPGQAKTSITWAGWSAYGHWSSNNWDYPHHIWIWPSGTNQWAQILQSGDSQALPSRGVIYMRAYVRPVTSYRYSMGVYYVRGYPNQYYRLTTIELDNDGIKLVNTGKSPAYLYYGAPDTGSNIRYFIILTTESTDINGNQLPAAAYAVEVNLDTGSWTWLGSAMADRGLDWAGYVYYGHIVWTDSSGNPASDYYVYGWWNYLYSIQT